MPTQIVDFAVAAPVIVGLVSALKIAGLPSRFAPLTAIVLGLIGSFFVFPAATVGLSAFWGIAAGLTASGLYSGVKTTLTPALPDLSSYDDNSEDGPVDPIA